jgi:nucleotide-binding universal stress UspA family protein
MAARLRQAAANAGVGLEIAVEHGDPAEVILLYAQTWSPDLLVLGAQQRTGVGDQLPIRAVSESVALRAGWPTLFVPRLRHRSADRSLKSFNRILCAIDFSRAATGALQYAMALADNDSNTRVTVLHVVPGYDSVLIGNRWRRLQDVVCSSEVARHAKARVYARVAAGEASTEIIRLAENLKPDLIVLGAASRVGGKTFGGTVGRVIHTTGAAVLTVPEAVKRANSTPLPMPAAA